MIKLKAIFVPLFLCISIVSFGKNGKSSGPLNNESLIITRLDRCVLVLKRFNDHHKALCQNCFSAIEQRIAQCQATECYKDPLIRSTLEMMHKQQCIEPLFEAWNSCKECVKNNISAEFLQEFSQIIFVVYKELIPVAQQAGIVHRNYA